VVEGSVVEGSVVEGSEEASAPEARGNAESNGTPRRRRTAERRDSQAPPG